jgi:hypothetical protein
MGNLQRKISNKHKNCSSRDRFSITTGTCFGARREFAQRAVEVAIRERGRPVVRVGGGEVVEGAGFSAAILLVHAGFELLRTRWDW